MGRIIKVGTANYGLTFSLIAEARALKDSVLLAVPAGYSMINIEGDNMIVIQALKGECNVSWQIAHIIDDVKVSLQHVIHVSINQTFREANMAADWLFKFGHFITDSFIMKLCFSPTLCQIIADDCIGHALMRRDA